MKTIRLTTLLLIASIVLSSCSILSSNQKRMMSIEKGMTKTEITRLAGTPDYRNFNAEIEEWIYLKVDRDLIVGFYNGLVETLTTLPPGSYNSRSMYPSNNYPPYSGSSVNPNYPNYPQTQNVPRIITDRDFSLLINSVSNEPNKERKFEVLRNGVYNRSFTCAQGQRVMSLFSFDDDKLRAFDIIAPNIVDWENQHLILDNFKFISSRENAKRTIDSLIYR